MCDLASAVVRQRSLYLRSLMAAAVCIAAAVDDGDDDKTVTCWAVADVKVFSRRNGLPLEANCVRLLICWREESERHVSWRVKGGEWTKINLFMRFIE